MTPADTTDESRPRRAGRTSTWPLAALLVLGVVVAGGYGLVRNFDAEDRAATRTAQLDPMARFVPPGTTLTDEIVQSSGRPTTRRAATIDRFFEMPQEKAAGAFAATVRAARAAGWRIERRNEEFASGDRPGVVGLTLQIRLSPKQPGT